MIPPPALAEADAPKEIGGASTAATNNANDGGGGARSRGRIARYAMFAIVVVSFAVLNFADDTTTGTTENWLAKKKKTDGPTGSKDWPPRCGKRLLPCEKFDFSRARGSGNKRNPYPRAKVMIARGCSMSSSAFAILKELVRRHHDPDNDNEYCRLRNELLKPKKNPCEGGTDENMTGPILDTIATLDVRFGGMPLVAKFEPNRLKSVEPEIHDYVAIDGVTVYRENLLDRALCMAMDCFNTNIATTVFKKNGTVSNLCFQRRFDKRDEIVLNVNVGKMREFIEKLVGRQRRDLIFDGHSTDAYKSEELVIFETSDDEKDFTTSYDLWIALLVSLEIDPINRAVVYELLKELQGKKKDKQPKRHRSVIQNFEEVRQLFFNDNNGTVDATEFGEKFRWMWRD